MNFSLPYTVTGPVSITVPKGVDRNAVMARMAEDDVDSRPFFYCAHQMPVHAREISLPISEDISSRGISLPSFPSMTDEDVVTAATSLEDALRAG